MSETGGIFERVGGTINELDIEFSRLTAVGWIVSVMSLGAGGGAGYLAAHVIVSRKGVDITSGLVFFVAMVMVATGAFLVLRWLAAAVGLSVIKRQKDHADATGDALQRMAGAGMDMSAAHTIDFLHMFANGTSAAAMAGEVRQMGFKSVTVETNRESGGYDVQVRVQLIPTLDNVSRMERTLATVAERHNGRADGWGVKQDR